MYSFLLSGVILDAIFNFIFFLWTQVWFTDVKTSYPKTFDWKEDCGSHLALASVGRGVLVLFHQMVSLRKKNILDSLFCNYYRTLVKRKTTKTTNPLYSLNEYGTTFNLLISDVMRYLRISYPITLPMSWERISYRTPNRIFLNDHYHMIVGKHLNFTLQTHFWNNSIYSGHLNLGRRKI